jgi:hypothetical protein
MNLISKTALLLTLAAALTACGGPEGEEHDGTNSAAADTIGGNYPTNYEIQPANLQPKIIRWDCQTQTLTFIIVNEGYGPAAASTAEMTASVGNQYFPVPELYPSESSAEFTGGFYDRLDAAGGTIFADVNHVVNETGTHQTPYFVCFH